MHIAITHIDKTAFFVKGAVAVFWAITGTSFGFIKPLSGSAAIAAKSADGILERKKLRSGIPFESAVI